MYSFIDKIGKILKMCNHPVGIVIIFVLIAAWEAKGDVNCTSTGAGRFADSNDTTCQSYTLCTYVSSSDEYVASNYTCPSSTVFNPDTAQCTNSSNYVCNVTTSVCTNDGYFADPTSTNCTSYVECILIDDTYTETTYTCPGDTLYNPNTTLCESDYNCTDSSDSDSDNTTSTNSTSNSTCTAEGYFSDSSSTSCSSYIECIFIDDGYIEMTYTCPNDTLFNPNTTLCESDYNCTETSDSSDNDTFSCTSAGRFANPDDSTCQTYYMCILSSNGTYSQYNYTCPSSAVFDPNSAYCTSSSNYVCNITSSSNSTSNTTSCTSEGFFADTRSTNCSSYIECILINDTYTETTYTCPDNFYFDPNTTYCESDYNCTQSTDSNTTDNTFTCTTAGRFANPEDTTCQTYYMCVLLSNESFVQTEYTCPTSAVFNPNTAYCTSSSNYVCNITSSNSSSVCTSDGYVADSSSTNCTSYIECVGNDNGTYTETTLTCPDDTFYNPNTTLCETDYNCTDSSNSTDTTFSCTEAGRFANTADTTCQTYYFCVSYSNGTFVQYEYTCPGTSVFSPTSQVCTTTYTCTSSG